MGAPTFQHEAEGPTPEQAFNTAREQAFWDYGHAGYTGTIAEKDSFTVIPVPAGADPHEYAESLIEADDARISDKWGPAGCIALGNNMWLFFGWASS